MCDLLWGVTVHKNDSSVCTSVLKSGFFVESFSVNLSFRHKTSVTSCSKVIS